MNSGKIVLHAIKMAAKCADKVSFSMTMDTITMSKMARKRSKKGGRNVSMITALLASAETWS
jgi:hypothetical protein